MIDLSNPGRFVFYLNFRAEGDGTNFAQAEQIFTFSQLIDDSSNYVLSIERFRIPIQSIPMQDSLLNAVTVVSKLGGVPVASLDLLDSYSLNDFLQQLNQFHAGLIFSLSEDGRMRVDYDGFANNNVTFDPTIAQIFDMDITIGVGLNGPGTVTGGTPIFDRFDFLHKLQIEAQTGLSSLQQEIVSTAVFANLLTDFLVPNNVSASFSGTPGIIHNPAYTLNYDVRQDIEFNSSSDRRFIMLKGNAPIQNIKLEVSGIMRDGTRRRIRLPPRSILEIKIAFWKKS